jgi:hypothetical protein
MAAIESRMKTGQRRRRFYSRVQSRQRDTWKTFDHAVGLISGGDHA